MLFNDPMHAASSLMPVADAPSGRADVDDSLLNAVQIIPATCNLQPATSHCTPRNNGMIPAHTFRIGTTSMTKADLQLRETSSSDSPRREHPSSPSASPPSARSHASQPKHMHNTTQPPIAPAPNFHLSAPRQATPAPPPCSGLDPSDGPSPRPSSGCWSITRSSSLDPNIAQPAIQTGQVLGRR